MHPYGSENSSSAASPAADGFRAQTQHVNEGQAYHELEHDGLTDRIARHALRHLAVRHFDVGLEAVLLALHDQDKVLLRVSEVGRDELHRGAVAQRVSLAFATQFFAVTIRANKTGSGLARCPERCAKHLRRVGVL